MQFVPVLIGCRGINFVRGSLNLGPLTWPNAVSKTFGWSCGAHHMTRNSTRTRSSGPTSFCASTLAKWLTNIFPFYLLFISIFSPGASTSTRDCSTCLICVSTCPSSSVVTFPRPSQMPHRRSSSRTHGWAEEIPRHLTSVRPAPPPLPANADADHSQRST